MEENKNTYIFKKNIVIEKKRETITPEFGDEFILCENLIDVYKRVSQDKLNHNLTVEDYSTESFEDYVTDYKLCDKLSINDKTYSFFGYKIESPDGTTRRKFFLYETQ
jgi:hypothetical protein